MNIPFEREHAAEYAADLIGWFLGLSTDTAGRLTDFNAGSNIRIFFEAIGLRFEHLDSKVFLALRRTIPSVLFEFFGEGDGVTTGVGFPRLPALPASGIVTYARDPFVTGDLPVPLGRRVAVPAQGAQPARVYVTTVPATLLADTLTVDVPVRALVAGLDGNTPAGTIRVLDGIDGIASATNAAAFINGLAAETDEGRRQRFVQYLRNLARSPAAGLEVGARTARLLSAGVVVEQVLFARAVDVPDKRGLVDLYVDNGGATASPALVAQAQAIVDGGFTLTGDRVLGYKAAGVEVHAKAVLPQVVDITAAVRLDAGRAFADIKPAIAAAVGAYLLSLGVFQDLYYADLICAIVGVDGVADLTGLTPGANVLAGQGQRIVPGVVTVLEAAAA